MSEVAETNLSTNRNGWMDPKVTVVGIGGAGSNIVNGLREHVDGVETVAINTDSQRLGDNDSDKKILIGRGITRGAGAHYPEVGARAAECASKEIEEALDGDIIVLVLGVGGGTGTGAGPVVAEIAKNRAITLAVAIKPFSYEGEARRQAADEGLRELQDVVKSVMVFENDSLLKFPELGMDEAMLEIPRKLIANVVKGVVEQVSMSFLTTLEEELGEMLAEDEGAESSACALPPREEPQLVALEHFAGLEPKGPAP